MNCPDIASAHRSSPDHEGQAFLEQPAKTRFWKKRFIFHRTFEHLEHPSRLLPDGRDLEFIVHGPA